MANNERPITTLLIGLGGSGGWTAVNVKRQLYDSYNNEMPENVRIIVLDTAANAIFQVGADGMERKPGMGIGQTILGRDEIAHVGGEVKDLVLDIDRTNKYPHIKSWFQSSWFLENLPDSVFNLDRGAGMFRQFGRLAIFRDVQTPGTSAVSEIINTTLTDLSMKMSVDDPALNVIVCGSLAGGTGAGMFLDIPHLVQRVADINSIKISVRGFLYLPDAFKANLRGEQRSQAHGRAFAALRELKRFLLNTNYDYGYPMHYHAPGAGMMSNLWRANNTGKLYDFVYMIDGTGLNDRKLEESTAVAVADGIVNFMDANYGPQQEQYRANVEAQVQNRRGVVGREAFVSSLGSYSIIMPIQQIMESWSYRLVHEFMDDLVPVSKDDSERPHKLRDDANPAMGTTAPREEINRMVSQLNAVTDPTNSDRQLFPLPLWKAAYDVYSKGENDETLVGRMRSYDYVDWLEKLVPDAENDIEVETLRNQTIQVLQQTVRDFTVPSNEREDGNPEDDFTDIKNTADRFVTTQLGRSVAGGGRQGGQYDEKLQRWLTFNMTRYRRYMTSYIQQQINGTDRSDIQKSRQGKLGWLLAMFKEMRTMFARYADVLEKLRTGAGLINPDNARVERLEMMQDAEKQMREEAPNYGYPGFRGSSPAVKAQNWYLDAVQEYVDFYRMEFTRNAIEDVIESIIAFTDDIIEEFRHWRDLLAVDTRSIYNQLLDGQRYIEYDRGVVGDIANHNVINDKKWEDEKFASYVDQEVRDNLYRRWQWAAGLMQEGRHERFRLRARMQGVHNEDDKNLLRRIDHVNWSEHNSELLLTHARRVFRDAISQESLVEYLRTRFTAASLATQLHEGAGYMISLKGTSQGQALSPGFILLARQASDDDRKYMNAINVELGKLNKRGDTADQNNPNQIVEQCANPFRMTYLATAELVALKSMAAYGESRDRYRELPWDTRQKNHIFPAEVNSMYYEERLKSDDYFDNPHERLLSDRVRLLMEHEDLFTEFMFLLVYNIVGKLEDDTGTTVTQYYVLRAPYQDGREGFDVWELTAHVDEPSLLDAAVSFVINQHDYTNENRKIPYEYIHAYLETVMEHDTASRLQNNELGIYNADVRDVLLDFSPPDDPNAPWTRDDDDAYVEIALLVARYDTVYELLWEYTGTSDGQTKNLLVQMKDRADKAEASADSGTAHNEAEKIRELYDMYSVAVIRLKDELAKYYRQLKRRHEERFG